MEARRTASEIRSLCAAVRESANGGLSEATTEWLRWPEAHADSIDPVITGVAMPSDPLPSRQALAPYLGSVSVHSYPWPFAER